FNHQTRLEQHLVTQAQPFHCIEKRLPAGRVAQAERQHGVELELAGGEVLPGDVGLGRLPQLARKPVGRGRHGPEQRPARTGPAEIRSRALELVVLPDDPHHVRRFADLLDHVVGDQAHALNSTTVTPWPPWFAGANPKRLTRPSAARISCTRWRTAPVPLPWMTRR